jgi:hypothetical protein
MGQAYLAGSEMGRNLARNEAVKVVCVRSPSNRNRQGGKQSLTTRLPRNDAESFRGRSDHALSIVRPSLARSRMMPIASATLGARR